MQAATSALPNGGPSPSPFPAQSGIASSSRPTTPFVPHSASTPTPSGSAATPTMTHQMPPQQQQQPPNAGLYSNYPPYAGQQQYMYQPNYYQHLPPRPPGGPANGNGGVYQSSQNHRFPDQYAQGFPPQPYYPFPQMGGPGPATMQNGYVYQPDYSQAYGRPAYPTYPSQSVPNDVNAAQQPQSQSQPFSAGVSGEHDNANPGPADNGSYQQHPPPPTLPPPSDYPTSFQHPPPPPFAQQHGGHPGQGYPAYFPPGHPYAYGGGVGYAPPVYPPYPGYDMSQQQHQQHPQHQQHNHQQPQQQHQPQQHFQQHQHSVPAIPQNHNRASSSTSATTSSRLNPAAAGFTFIPAAKREASVNGTAEKKESVPVFASLAHPSTTAAATGTSSVGGPATAASSLPNGHQAGGQANTKKWVQPVIANGEKFKGLKVPDDDVKLEANGSSGTGLGLTMDGSTSTAPSEAKSSTASTTPQQSNATPAMSTSPTTATTPVSVRTPRAASADIEDTDGEATILFSPQASSPSRSSRGVLKFIGSPVSGYTSPPSSAHVPMQSFGQVQAQEVVRLSKKKDRKEAVDAEPYRLVQSTPAVDATGTGVFYAKKLERAIPEKYRREHIQVKAKEVVKRHAKAFGSKGARVKIGVKGEKIPKRKGEQLVFGEIAAKDASPKAPQPKRVTAGKPAAASTSTTTAAPAATAAPTSSATQAAPAQPAPVKVKPSSWAALLHTGSTAPSTAASSTPTRAPSVSFSSPAEAGPSRLPASPSAEPITPKSTASALPPTSTGGRPTTTNRPSFNYAAAAAAAAGLTPQEELAKILAEGVKGKGKEVGVVPRGLINTGNMCFANTILQVLVYCTPFTDLLEELSKRLKADLGRKTPLLEAMIIFLREFIAGPGASAPPVLSGTSTPRSENGKAREQRKDAFVPENVYDAMKENKRFDSMRRGHQEDAEEYLGFFLDTLHEELLYLISRTQSTRQINGQPQPNGENADERSIQRPVSPSAATDDGDGWLEVGKKQKTNVVRSTETRISAITRLFGGTFRSHLRTPGAKDSVTLEPYQPLQLDVQSPEISSITDALKHLSAPEVVPGVWSASRKANVDATKQIYVETFPPVLMLHLKRFVYDSQMCDVVKRSKPVAYGTELDIPAEIMSPGRKASVRYRLFGVVYHHGTSASGGHYTVAVSRQDKAGWIHFDDESVTTVPTEQVIVSPQEAEDAKEGRGNAGGLLIGGRERCAYLLFYQRVRAA